MSIQGGPHTAFERAEAAGCDTVQIFTKNTGTWKARPLGDDEIRAFHARARASPVKPVLAHAAYLPNLASPSEDLRRLSIEAVHLELERCEALGIDHLILHPGAHMGAGEEAGLARVVRSLAAIHAATRGFRAGILLETTAGQGTCLGHRLAFFGDVLARVKEPERVGVCIDTCHLFAAGYDLRSEEGYGAAMEDLERSVGLQKLRAIHLNDSKRELGSRVDRHEHIGKGQLGLGAFRLLLNDRRCRGIPMFLETPKEGDMDRKNLATLRRLRGSPGGARA
jgi:deoxyribonuclease-4